MEKEKQTSDKKIEEILKDTKVGDYMTRNILVGKDSFTLKHVARLFNELKIHHLPIVNKLREIVGIISANDLLRVCSRVMDKGYDREESELDQTIVDYMTSTPVVCSPDDSIVKAIEIFAEGKFHALPVVENNELVGIFTANDLIELLNENLARDSK